VLFTKDLIDLSIYQGCPATQALSARMSPISDDSNLDIDKLKARKGYRLRVGQYRIIYTRHEDQLIIEVVKIRSRGDIYKG